MKMLKLKLEKRLINSLYEKILYNSLKNENEFYFSKKKTHFLISSKLVFSFLGNYRTFLRGT
jgi:hypothetical protein